MSLIRSWESIGNSLKEVYLQMFPLKTCCYCITYLIPEEEIKLFSPSLVQTIIVKHPAICKFLQPENVTTTLEINSAECFELMPPAVQAATLVLAKILPNAALDHVNAGQVSEWHFGKWDQEWTGIKVFNARATPLTNMEVIANGLGWDPNGDNPCTEIKNLEELETVKVLMDNMSYTCFHATGIKLPEEPKQRAGHRKLALLMPYSELCHFHNGSFFRNITLEDFAQLVRGEAFCSYVDRRTFDLLPLSVLKAVDVGCYSDLSIPLRKEQIRAFPDSLFGNVGVRNIPPSDLRNLSPGQLGNLAVDVKDPTQKNLGTVLTASIVGAMDSEQIGVRDENTGELVPQKPLQY